MSNLEALLLGVVQGLTEFLPISSSGHLILIPWLQDYTFLTDNESFNKTFDVALHAGTLIAAIAFFRLEVWRLLISFFGVLRRRSIATSEERLAIAIAIGTDPGGDRRRPRLRLHRRTPRRAVDDRGPADLLRRLARLGRPPPPGTAAGGLQGQGRPLDRHRPGAGARPRHLALGDHDHRRPLAWPRPRRRRPLLLPAADPDRRRRDPLQGGQRGQRRAAARASAGRWSSASSPPRSPATRRSSSC